MVPTSLHDTPQSLIIPHYLDLGDTKNFIHDSMYAETVEKLKTELTRLRTELKVPPISEEPRAAYGKVPFDDPATMPFRKAGGKDKTELDSQ
jgi:hypothetical protein